MKPPVVAQYRILHMIEQAQLLMLLLARLYVYAALCATLVHVRACAYVAPSSPMPTSRPNFRNDAAVAVSATSTGPSSFPPSTCMSAVVEEEEAEE